MREGFPITIGLIEASAASCAGQGLHVTRDPIALAVTAACPLSAVTVGIVDMHVADPTGVTRFVFDEHLALWVERFDEFVDGYASRPEPITVELDWLSFRARVVSD